MEGVHLAIHAGVVVLGLDFDLNCVEGVEEAHWATAEVEVVGLDFGLNYLEEEMDLMMN